MKKNKNLNKIWTNILAIILVSISFSCTDLDEDPGRTQLGPDALTSVPALNNLVTGTYRSMFEASKWSDYWLVSYGGDDVTTHSGLNKLGFRESDWRDQSHTSDRTLMAYEQSYKVIANTNVAINAQDAIQGDEGLKKILMGEMYFLRALNYLHLTRTFGRVPIVLDPSDTEPDTKAEFIDIYQLIESDLLKAEELLPQSYPGVAVIGARPSKGAAKAFLARLYMHWAGYPIKDNSKYAMAATKAGEVINGGFGYSLAPTLREMWTITGQFGHNEGIFTMIANLPNYGNRTVGRLGTPVEAGGWNENFGEIAFYEDMEATATAEGTLVRFNDTYVSEKITRGSRPFGSDWRDWADPHPILRKVAGSEGAIWNSNNADLNRYFLRYADVLLMYAEANGRSGGSSADAWEALNKVRRRAAGLNPNTPNASIDKTAGDLAELAYTERKWELAGEFERWHDLVRMERVAEAFANRSPDEPVDIVNAKTPSTSGKFLYFNPIPQVVIDLSPGLAD